MAHKSEPVHIPAHSLFVRLSFGCSPPSSVTLLGHAALRNVGNYRSDHVRQTPRADFPLRELKRSERPRNGPRNSRTGKRRGSKMAGATSKRHENYGETARVPCSYAMMLPSFFFSFLSFPVPSPFTYLGITLAPSTVKTSDPLSGLQSTSSVHSHTISHSGSLSVLLLSGVCQNAFLLCEELQTKGS